MAESIARNKVGDDLFQGLGLYKSWVYLSYQDLISRYRRSILGPVWISGIMISQAAALSIVFSTIYHVALQDFLPYIICGLSVFGFIAAPFGEGSETFAIFRPIINSHPLPMSFHIFRMTCRHFIILLHNLVVFFVVYLAINHSLAVSLMIIPGAIICVAFVTSCMFIIAPLCARFRDLKFALPYVWNLVFYLTPVVWKAGQIGKKSALIYEFNPFYYALEVVRGPLLGTPFEPVVFLNAILVTIAAMVLAGVVFMVTRKSIALWI